MLEVKDLKTYFFGDEGTVKAVDGVDFTVKRGATVGIVGESGCGKSVTAMSILQLVDRPGRIVGGQILLNRGDGETAIDLAALHAGSTEMRAIRGDAIAMIFQEPMNSLSPVHTIGNQIIETIQLHRQMSKEEARAHAIEVLRRVGIPRPETRIDAYTFQLSGGMRQRAMIAMALACNPLLLIADEPTTALDVSIQAQILRLIQRIVEERQVTVLLITHDMGVIAKICTRVAVMYGGTVVEQGTVEQIFNQPKHPYTLGLLQAIPSHEVEQGELAGIPGSPPNFLHPPTGCRFHPRCPKRLPHCHTHPPASARVSEGHEVACYLYTNERRA